MSKGFFESALNAEGLTGHLADLARSIFQQESGSGANTKTSNAGAVGGMQVIPSTFNSVADQGWDINNPEHNARAGMRYLKMLDKKSGGDPALTAAGYYGGPGGMAKARQGIAVYDPRNPGAPNTLQYAQEVAARLPGAGVKVGPVAVPVPAQAPPVVMGTAPVMQDPDQLAVQTPPQQVAALTMPEWTDFQRAMPQGDVRPNDLNYGPMASVVAPEFSQQFNLPRHENLAVNFKGFAPRKLRA